MAGGIRHFGTRNSGYWEVGRWILTSGHHFSVVELHFLASGLYFPPSDLHSLASGVHVSCFSRYLADFQMILDRFRTILEIFVGGILDFVAISEKRPHAYI